MIDRVLIRTYIGQSALLFCSCGAVLFIFGWLSVWVVSLVDMSRFELILDQLRAFEKFAPIEFDALLTYEGRVGIAFDDPVVMLCTVIWCIARGSDVVSGELGRGTMEMLLAQPIKRTQLLFSHAIVSVLGLAMLCLLLWAGIGVGVRNTTIEETIAPPSVRIPFIEVDIPLTTDKPIVQKVSMRDRIDVRVYAAPVFHLFSFGFFVLALATMFSSMDRYRWRTVGTVVAVYVVQLVMFGLGKAAESLDWLLSISFFSCYKPQKMISIVGDVGLAGPWSLTGTTPGAELAPLMYPGMLITLGLVCYTIAAIRFTKRDLPAPL